MLHRYVYFGMHTRNYTSHVTLYQIMKKKHRFHGNKDNMRTNNQHQNQPCFKITDKNHI